MAHKGGGPAAKGAEGQGVEGQQGGAAGEGSRWSAGEGTIEQGASWGAGRRRSGGD
jgi:hypothetical protein